MLVFIIRYICAIIAVFTTLLFVSNIITNMTSSSVFIAKENGDYKDNSINHAAFRLILSLIMSITWPLVFML